MQSKALAATETTLALKAKRKRAPGGGRKPLPDEDRKPRLTFRIDPETLQRLEEYQADLAPEHNRSKTIVEAIRLYLDTIDFDEGDTQILRDMIRSRKTKQ